MITKSYKAEVLQGIHTLTDTYKVALYQNSAVLGSDTTAYTPTGEISANGYVAGGVVLDNAKITSDELGATLDFDDVVIENCNIVMRKILIYNASKDNRSVAVQVYETDFGIIGNGTFVLQIPSGIIKAT